MMKKSTSKEVDFSFAFLKYNVKIIKNNKMFNK